MSVFKGVGHWCQAFALAANFFTAVVAAVVAVVVLDVVASWSAVRVSGILPVPVEGASCAPSKNFWNCFWISNEHF